MRSEVAIKGSGLAACCSAALLMKAGFKLTGEPHASGKSPVLMLSQQTQRLLRDVFGCPNLYDGALPIKRRVVLWGRQSEPVELPHAGLVMPEATLLARLWSAIELETATSVAATANWTLISDRQKLTDVLQRDVGSRTAFTNSVQLSNTAARDACWVESVSSGWLFLIPSGGNGGSLVSVGADAESLLSESRLVSEQILSLQGVTGCFPSHPRIGDRLGGPGWIACGTAAVAFDPIAGEGAGHALREGILAAAVIRAASRGLELQRLIDHYSNRILSGFLRHLQHCIRFYESLAGDWWQAQAQALNKGILWTENELSSRPGGFFRLNGFELESIE